MASQYPYPANKENTLSHSLFGSSSHSAHASAPYAPPTAALNPLAQSQSSHYHRPLPPSPTKTTATAVVNPYGRSSHHHPHHPHPLAQSTSTPSAYSHSSDPTVAQLLAAQSNSRHAAAAAAAAGTSQYPNPNPYLQRDSTLANATGIVSWRKGQGFKEWEKVKLDSAEVKRKADVAQLCTPPACPWNTASATSDQKEPLPPDFYDHYFDLLTYLSARKTRLASFKRSAAGRNLAPPDLAAEWSSYAGRERVLLRKRRTKLRLGQFHIVTQVGQGGYGEVYLARHKETQQVVALKKMKKRTLAKMDEVRPRNYGDTKISPSEVHNR